jgi:membrane fusion protein
MTKQSALFRQEVFDAKKNSWLGDIVLIRPTSFMFMTIVVAAIAITLLCFLFWGEYTRKAKANGYIVPNQGIIKVIPQQAGLVVELRVIEGQTVNRGDVLAVLNTERVTANGDAQAGITKQIASRRVLFTQEREKIAALYAQQAVALNDRHASLTSEIQQIDRNVQLQKDRIRITEAMLATQRRLNSEKFISDLALQQKEQERLADLSVLENLNRSRMTLQRDMANVGAEIAAQPLKRESEIATVDRNLAMLEQDRIEVESRRETHLTASQSGTVTAIATDRGKLAIIGMPLMSIIPHGALMEADLYIPARSAGFVREGSKTLLQYQAYPYQKFGSHAGSVARMSRTAVSANELPFPAAQGELYYVARIALEKQTVKAYGKEQPLQSGMLVDANILLDRRTLFEWVFEPLYSITGRWAK